MKSWSTTTQAPGGPAAPAVYCSAVSKSYGSKRALDDLNLEIPRGKLVGILGPNGAGKSTLFRILTGLARPDSGQVRVMGETPGWTANRFIAYLPDRARWYARHTVEEAFRWAHRFLPGFVPEEACRLAEFMRLDLRMRAGEMSRGQEARLMLILCIARRVPLVILDEPFAGIDAVSRARIVEGLIDHISGSGVTVLVSTHELYEAEPLFDHAVFLDAGRVRLQGAADELRRRGGSMQEIMHQLYR